MSDLESMQDVDENTSVESILKDDLLAKIDQWYAGDLHTHSTHTNRGEVAAAGPNEGVHSMELVLDYATKLGRKFVVFSEHSSDPGSPSVLHSDHPIFEQVRAQSSRIQELNSQSEGARAYSGIEANLLIDASGEAVIDVPDEILGELDFRIASIHEISNANKRDPEILRQLMLAAIENPNIDEVGHPYRHVEFHPHDWAYFKKYWRDQIKFAKDPNEVEKAEQILQQLDDIDIRKDYETLKKIIGKAPVEGTEDNLDEIITLGGQFNELYARYWNMWGEVFEQMQERGTIFEINLNSFNPSKEYYRQLVMLAGRYPRLNYSLVFDFHNTEQHRKGIKEKDLNQSVTSLFENRNGMRKARGRELAARKLLDTIVLLEQVGVTPESVINSSEESFMNYVQRRRG